MASTEPAESASSSSSSSSNPGGVDTSADTLAPSTQMPEVDSADSISVGDATPNGRRALHTILPPPKSPPSTNPNDTNTSNNSDNKLSQQSIPETQETEPIPDSEDPWASLLEPDEKPKEENKQSDAVSPASTTSASSPQPNGAVDIDTLIAKLRALRRNQNRGCIDITALAVEKVCLQTRAILMAESALVEIDCPMKIVGDIHGQYFDLLRMFELGGYPDGVTSRYIFLGDYVDRGSHSLEVILLLFCYKIKFRKGFFLLRGNHECGSINRIYGFFDECKRRYPDGGIHLWKTFTDVFNYLPVAAIIDEKIFCMHGGLSPTIMKRGALQQIANIKRPTDVPDRGLLCDLLWADPDPFIDTWGPNDRGVSYTFGSAVLNQFLAVHDMDLICRAHQVVEDGYEFFGLKRLVTIFSAPNYCNEFDNAGAMMSVDTTLMCSFHVLKPNYKRKTRFYH